MGGSLQNSDPNEWSDAVKEKFLKNKRKNGLFIGLNFSWKKVK